jgi:hypothetical protein
VSVQELELAVQQLSPAELTTFRRWFAEFDWQLWDKQLERDVKAGKLDRFGAEALDDVKNGRCRDI